MDLVGGQVDCFFDNTLFASGEYRDRFVLQGGQLLLAERIAVCDSTVTDTLLALPL